MDKGLKLNHASGGVISRRGAAIDCAAFGSSDSGLMLDRFAVQREQ